MITRERRTDLQSLLVSCHRAPTAREYASDLVRGLARVFDSPVCVWLNETARKFEPLAWTADAEPHLAEILFRCTAKPGIENEAAPGNTLETLITVPMLFRSSPGGVLMLANRCGGYTQADCEILLEAGRIALLEHEKRRLAGDAGYAPGEKNIASFVHKLRQPLSIIDTCAYFLDMVLPQFPEKSHAQISVIQQQVAIADRILTEAVQSLYPSQK